MLDRRTLLKKLAAITTVPFIIKGESAAKIIPLDINENVNAPNFYEKELSKCIRCSGSLFKA